ncbi:uncharacterized protein LOC100204279 isoform X2 [Hydra vulgaris]|uniref:uncharacterized protein LOC100204279 isoform X2 n=1 Tax=Hydra vulgaris TaxID=6087 RepID=UPI001F5F91B4|nr:uncharacterized protein LOC100204279 isoform X2 [Hydra vulgaris]
MLSSTAVCEKEYTSFSKPWISGSEFQSADSLSSASLDESDNIEDKPLQNLTTESVPSNKKRKFNVTKDEKKNTEYSKKLANLKKYLKMCDYRINNYAKLFENCKTVKSKEDKLLSILKDIGVEGRPTLQKCKKIRLEREKAREVAELDCSNIIQARCRHSAKKEVIKHPRAKYSFGDLSVDSEASVSDASIHDIQPRKRQRISSDEDGNF